MYPCAGLEAKSRFPLMAKASGCTRRSFLRLGLGIAAGTPFVLSEGCSGSGSTPPPITPIQAAAKVTIVSCTDYGSSLQPALAQAFNLLGGIGALVNGKTVAVKINQAVYPYPPL